MDMYIGVFFNKIVPDKFTQRPLFFFFPLSAALEKIKMKKSWKTEWNVILLWWKEEDKSLYLLNDFYFLLKESVNLHSVSGNHAHTQKI